MTMRFTRREWHVAAALLVGICAAGPVTAQDLPQKHALLFGINRYQAEIAGEENILQYKGV